MIVVRIGAMSRRVPVHPLVATAMVLAAGVAVAIWSLTSGDARLAVADALRALVGGGDEGAAFVVRTLRLPRVATGAAVGASLGMSGAIFQALARNPLASPDVVGFTSGSSVGAVAAITVVGATSVAAIAAAAVLGGVLVAVLVVAAAWRGGLRVDVLLLVGIGAALTSRALVDVLLVRADLANAQRAMVWMVGSLSGRTWDDVRLAGFGLIVFGAAAMALDRARSALACGDDLARAWGWHPERSRLLLAGAGVGLAATATAAAGPVGFVALMAPPVARAVTHAGGSALLPAAAVGATLVVGADVAGRSVGTLDLPVGVTTSLLGAPYLIWLLVRGRGVRT